MPPTSPLDPPLSLSLRNEVILVVGKPTDTSCSIWDCILGQTKVAQENGSDPLDWSIHISSNLSSLGITLPSLEFANHLVSHIFWENNVAIAWKFLEKAMDLKIVPPFLVLGLLSERSPSNLSISLQVLIIVTV